MNILIVSLHYNLLANHLAYSWKSRAIKRSITSDKSHKGFQWSVFAIPQGQFAPKVQICIMYQISFCQVIRSPHICLHVMFDDICQRGTDQNIRCTNKQPQEKIFRIAYQNNCMIILPCVAIFLPTCKGRKSDKNQLAIIFLWQKMQFMTKLAVKFLQKTSLCCKIKKKPFECCYKIIHFLAFDIGGR